MQTVFWSNFSRQQRRIFTVYDQQVVTAQRSSQGIVKVNLQLQPFNRDFARIGHCQQTSACPPACATITLAICTDRCGPAPC